LNGEWSVVALPLDVQGEEGYKVFADSNADRMPAQVPGEIHLDLMRAGKMEGPSVSDNARTQGRWPEEHSWWYRTEFTPPRGFREHFRQRLVFDGIDLCGQVFVNGNLAGTTNVARRLATLGWGREANGDSLAQRGLRVGDATTCEWTGQEARSGDSWSEDAREPGSGVDYIHARSFRALGPAEYDRACSDGILF
jgi:hypothetical protein